MNPVVSAIVPHGADVKEFRLRREDGAALPAWSAGVDCKRGECGSCFTQVVDGNPLHRDICLTPARRSVGMCTCVSWASGSSLVLDM